MNPRTTQQAFDAYETVRHRLPDVRRLAPERRALRVRCLDDIAEHFDVFLPDAFVVLNIVVRAIGGVPERVAGLQSAGTKVLVVTNVVG
ncbi:MAG: hypothetical protein HKP40_13795 [Litoreibacter sp.]|nr:hypothetical protein [Litoreibacter sp.]